MINLNLLRELTYFQIFLYVSIIAVIIIAIIYIIKMVKQRTLGKFINKKGFNIPAHNSQVSTMYDEEKIKQPLKKKNFSYGFTINIDNFYDKNVSLWRHIFHKGTQITKESYEDTFNNWVNVEHSIPEQSIGVWLHPNINNIRVAITTINQSSMSQNLEYIDVENIPSNTNIHICVVIKDTIIEIYQDKYLIKTKPLRYIPSFEPGNLFLTYKPSFQGNITNFKYIPRDLNSDEVKSL